MNIICRTCGGDFEYQPKRGRPPVACSVCKAAPKVAEEKISAKQRVDRLELMLRVRNTHVEQQKDDPYYVRKN
jgi:hypothetical protein